MSKKYTQIILETDIEALIKDRVIHSVLATWDELFEGDEDPTPLALIEIDKDEWQAFRNRHWGTADFCVCYASR